MKAPIAEKSDSTDQYDWLRDKNWPRVDNKKVIKYLEAENEYHHVMSDKALEKQIFAELKARIKEDDESYPVKKDNFYYFTRTVKDKDYPILCRKSDKEEILLDGNILAEDKSSFALGAREVSNDHKKLVYAFDADGSERYTIKIRDLKTFQDLQDVITDTIGEIVWNTDSTGFYYLKLNNNWRPDRVFFHKLGTSEKKDVLIYQELDSQFRIHLEKSASEEFLFINTGNGSNNEIMYLPLNKDDSKPMVFIPRKIDHLYMMDHINNEFYLLTNDMGRNFRLVTFVDNKIDKEIIPHSDEYYLVEMYLYNQFLVVTKKVKGLNWFELYKLEDHSCAYKLNFNEQPYQASAIFTHKDDPFLRISFSSLITPRSILELEFSNFDLHTRKTDEVKGYDSKLYSTERLWAEAGDSTKIPISIVYRKDKLKHPSPLLLYGYGSYGSEVTTNFRSNVISLLDRGFIYAIAHIRGGDELGFDWYESAKFLNKKRTFNDFISCAEYLIKQGYTSSDKLSIMGGSAGGMLMGAVINERPELFKAVVALVPFVDVLNTMLDETLPLTPGEFEEWGNPKNQEYFNYIKSYSPYDNVEKKEYPAMLVTAGLTDPRVGYWEAAKWVAKLRAYKQDDNLLLLKTDMDAGHAGKSGRFRGLEEVAMIYSFILNIVS